MLSLTTGAALAALQLLSPPSVESPGEAREPGLGSLKEVEAPQSFAGKAPLGSSAGEPKTPDVAVQGAAGNGVTLDFGAPFSLNLRTRLQLRYQLDVSREDPEGEREIEQNVGIGTARLWLSGHAYTRELSYLLQLALGPRDYRDGALSPIYDAYLDYRAHRDLGVRVGQFFVPFDRLRTVREWALQMADRPRVVAELTLDRDVGLKLYSDEFLADGSSLAFHLGAFSGGGSNMAEGKQPGALLVGRLELRPLAPIDDDLEGDHQRRAKPGLALGVGVANNWNSNRLRSTNGSTFSGGTTDYLHVATDLVFKWFGFALQAEHLWKQAGSNQIVSVDDDGTELSEFTRSGRGWVLQGSYTFDPPLEVVGRLGRLYASPGTDPVFQEEVVTRGQEVGAGLNYYFNGHKLKLQADWIARMAPGFEADQADHVTHLQLDATF